MKVDLQAQNSPRVKGHYMFTMHQINSRVREIHPGMALLMFQAVQMNPLT